VASPALATEWAEYHQGADRTGVGPSAPGLSSPKIAWTANLDGAVYASPLIVDGHVLVATENNTVYSLDLFSGSVVWKNHLGQPVDAGSLPCGNIGPVTGITGTPAADPATGRLYVVAFLHSHHHMLFTLSLADGSLVSQRDVDPPGSDPTVQQERGALALGSGYVYVPLGGLEGDCGFYHGYLEAVPIGGGAIPTYRVATTREAGIWSPQGATVASSGSVFAVTGNGAPTNNFGYSDAVLEFSPDLHLRTYFAPSNWESLNVGDTDLGSVGATLMPSLGAVVAVGKQGVVYVMEMDHLGGIGGQVAERNICQGAWGGTATSGVIVYIPCSNGLYAVKISAGAVGVVWHTQHPVLGSPILAAGAVWAIEPSSGILYALNPANGATMYSVSLGKAEHFSTPAATEGFVVTPAGSRVVAISTTN
jgi:outer membrane protein assembly factor BamB